MADRPELNASPTPSATAPRAARDAASFRDPDGFIFRRDGEVLRQVNPGYAEDFGALVASGLLGSARVLPVETLGAAAGLTPEAIETLRPEPLPFLSYPWEWTFGMLKEAALLTLDLAREALDAGMVLKDASAFNVAFRNGKAVHFDTLSFERYVEGEPWIAYAQYCRHFLAPLAIAAKVSGGGVRGLRSYLDGMPLSLASRLLPFRTRFQPGLAIHIHAHARATEQKRATEEAPRRGRVSKIAQMALLDSLRKTTEGLVWEPSGTEWADYVDDNSYDAASTAAKREIVGRMLARAGGSVCWDLGANTGEYSRLAADGGYRVVAWDVDPGAAERHHRRLRAENDARITPLLQDLTNPTPDLGWNSRERPGFFARADADVAMGLALVHHLRISGGAPLTMAAELFARVAPWAIVEWVPKEDVQVRRLLASREDVFHDYDEAGFRAAFEERFDLVEAAPIAGSPRMLYLWRRK